MKALSQLDHVMLWVARSFAALFLGYTFYLCLRDGYIILNSLQAVHWRWSESATGIVEFLATLLLVFVPMNISLWRQSKFLSRFYLVLIGSVFFLGGGATECMTAITLNGLDWKLEVALALLGFATVLWVAIRPSNEWAKVP